MFFHKTTVEIDIEALRRAEAALGTSSIKDTVNGALRDVGRRAALARAAQYVLEGRVGVPDESTLDEWRRPRS
jgi:Arc/MetJ family transcription regulator